MAKVTPAAKTLYDEMRKAGFEKIINFIPGGDGFWPFLKDMASIGICAPCKEGGGDPGCAIRICAKEKNVEMCALCDEYPCEKFNTSQAFSIYKEDNALLREQGMEAWAKLQDERRSKGFVYSIEGEAL
jgi:hypothetical protein